MKHRLIYGIVNGLIALALGAFIGLNYHAPDWAVFLTVVFWWRLADLKDKLNDQQHD